MFERLDSFLVDRIFQPLADALARWTSCYGIAAFLLTGVIFGQVAGYIWMEKWAYAISMPIWSLMKCIQAYELERRPPSDVLPIERIQGQIWAGRPGLLLIEIFAQPMILLIPPPDGKVMWIYEQESWWVVIIACYFMACRRNPPKPRRAKIPGNVVLAGSQ
jgi:hypothetical protein